MPRTAFRLFVTAVLLLAPSIAIAHPGHGADTGLIADLIHAFSRVDHLLTTTAVGAGVLGLIALLALSSRSISR